MLKQLGARTRFGRGSSGDLLKSEINARTTPKTHHNINRSLRDVTKVTVGVYD